MDKFQYSPIQDFQCLVRTEDGEKVEECEKQHEDSKEEDEIIEDRRKSQKRMVK